MGDQEGQVAAPDREEQLATARVAYQGAIAAWTYEGTGLWAVFSAMVTANSVVIAIATFLWDRPLTVLWGRMIWVTPIINLVGLCLCIAWASITSRRHKIHDYRVLAAREIEERHLSSITKLLADGATLSDGGEVSLRGQKEPFRMEGLGRIRGKKVMMSVILLFGALHAILGGARIVTSSGPPRAEEKATALTTLLQQEMKRRSELEAERARLAEELKTERELREKLLQKRMPKYRPKSS